MRVRCDTSISKPRLVPERRRRRRPRRVVAVELPLRRRSAGRYRWPCSARRQDVELLAAVRAVAVAETPSSSSTSSVRYTVDGMVSGSTARQRSTSSAPVTWPSVCDRTSTRIRRCGVQRRPRARSRSGMPAQAGRRPEPVDDPSGVMRAKYRVDERQRRCRCNTLRYAAMPRYAIRPASEDRPLLDVLTAVADHPPASACWSPASPSASATASTGITSRRSPTSPARRPRPASPRPPTRSSIDRSPATTTATAARSRVRPRRRVRAPPRSPRRCAVARRRAARFGRGAARGRPARHAVCARARAGRRRARDRGAGVRRAPARLARPDHGPHRRADAGRPRPVGPLLRLSLRPRRRVVPPAQPLDAPVRRGPLLRGGGSTRGCTATSTSSRSR